ncbi:phage tail protein, partial [Pseudomonas aeruginosa]
VLDNSKVDLSIKLPLTERVIVKKLDDGRLEVTHPDEPQLEPFLPAGN